MLKLLPTDDSGVVTVYSSDIAIGGLSLAGDDLWYWALFVLRSSERDLGDRPAPLGGVAADQSEAYAALSARWHAWLKEAGLAYNDSSPAQ